MSRAARIKNTEAVYHVMSRSITEFDMFKEDVDKDHFLDLLQQLKEKYRCRVYSYCIMTNHYHIFLDPNGVDVSKFMKSLNQRYVKYVNKKHKRRGSLLAERFNSKIVENAQYALTVSAYIHNNPKDIEEYCKKVFDYPYSSMGIYLGTQKDSRNLVDCDFILKCVNENDKPKALAAYVEMVNHKRATETDINLKKYLEDFAKEQYEYKSYRVVLLRNKKPEEVIKVIAEKFGIASTNEIMHKWKRKSLPFRQAVAYALITFCGMGTKEACQNMKNISGTCLSQLWEKGFNIFQNSKELASLFAV